MKKMLLAFMMLLMGTQAPAANWYVDNITTGSNTGTSWPNAWRSFPSISWSSVNAGDTVFISGGTDTTLYADTLDIKKSGTGARQLVFTIGRETGHNGHIFMTRGIKAWYRSNLVLDGSIHNDRIRWTVLDSLGAATSNGGAVSLYESDSLLIKRLQIMHSNKHGIQFNASKYAVVRNCHIHHVLWDGINIGGALTVSDAEAQAMPDPYNMWQIDSCIIDSCGDDGIQSGLSRVTLTNNFIRYANNGLTPTGAHPDGFQANPETKYLRVNANTFVNCMQAAYIEKTKGFVAITNNVFYDVPAELPSGHTNRALSINESSTEAEGPVLFANNVLYNLQWSAMFIGSPIFESNAELIIRNNIFLNCQRIHIEIGYFPELIRGDNIFFTTPDAPPPLQTFPDSGLKVNPLFVDHNHYNFALQTASPARNTGVNLSQYFTIAHNGNPRPAIGAWDIGIYQYGASAIPVTTGYKILAPATSRQLIYYTVTGARMGFSRSLPNGIYLVQDYVNGPLRKVALLR